MKNKIRNETEKFLKTSEKIVSLQNEEKDVKLISSFGNLAHQLSNKEEVDYFFPKKRINVGLLEKENSNKAKASKNKKINKNIEKIFEIEEDKQYDATIYYKKKGRIPSLTQYKNRLIDKMADSFDEDYIETCSITWDMEFIKNPNQDIPYYRELAPYAREIINLK